MDHQAAIREYYRAFRDRDRAALEKLLVADFRHSSPFGLFENRDSMLDEIWPSVGQHWAEDIEVFGDGPDYMVRYRHSTGGLMAEHFCFDGDLLAAVEVYVGRSSTSPLMET